MYTLPLHDAIPISVSLSVATGEGKGFSPAREDAGQCTQRQQVAVGTEADYLAIDDVGEQGAMAELFALVDVGQRSEEHTSELQSRTNLVCRLLLEKKKNKSSHKTHTQTSPPHSTPLLFLPLLPFHLL